MMQFSLVALLAASAVTVSAQVYPVPNPDDISDGTKDQWCVQQEASCDLLCQNQESGNQYENSCDPKTLAYVCICDDGKIPNATEYSQTIPYYLCQEGQNLCVENCASSDDGCTSACRENKSCGASNPTKVNITEEDTEDSSSSSSGSGGKKGSGSSGSGSSDEAEESSSSGDKIDLKSAGVIAYGEVYGFAALVTTLFVSTFAILL